MKLDTNRRREGWIDGSGLSLERRLWSDDSCFPKHLFVVTMKAHALPPDWENGFERTPAITPAPVREGVANAVRSRFAPSMAWLRLMATLCRQFFWLLSCAGFVVRLAAVEINRGTNAEQLYRVTRWTTEQGLPQNRISCLKQTRDGYVWLGTWFGLARFDGVRFTV